jgi:hypothetical protein
LQWYVDVGIFYGHLVFIFSFLVIFFPFWYVVPRKIWQPWPKGEKSGKFEGEAGRAGGRVCV